MCGIAGVLHFDSQRLVNAEKLSAMRDILAHRGPDNYDQFIEENIGLAHRRLSIIDLSEEARQPFFSADGRFVIIFNGEIFNFKELRLELETIGIRFKTNSDTEVLLYAYIHYGIAALSKLNGMFAFVIWDRSEKKLFVGRDRIGIKPFYYSLYDNSFYFASEQKALFNQGIPSTVQDESLQELLLFRYVGGENSIFKYVKKLLPGHCIEVTNNGSYKLSRWWNLPKLISNNREKQQESPEKWFEETFYSSVKYRTISDVPVGVMLSGGLDSTSVACALNHNNQKKLAAFTITFQEESYNEGPLAKQVAEKFDLNYHAVNVTGSQLMEKLQQACWYHDEPLVHQNDTQILALSQYAKQYVTVLLSGEGGDELMGGYVRYKALNHFGKLKGILPYIGLLSKVTGNNRFDKLQRYFSNATEHSILLFNAINVFPSDVSRWGIQVDLEKFEYRNNIIKEARSIYPKEPVRQAMYLDMFTHMSSILDRNDRMTMGASIECRVPFLDFRLLEGIPALPSSYLLKGKKGKHLLMKTFGKFLPNEVKSFKKLGLSVPWEKYLDQEPFKGAFNDLIYGDNIVKDFYPQIKLDILFKEFKNGVPCAQMLLRQFLMIYLWEKNFLKKL